MPEFSGISIGLNTKLQKYRTIVKKLFAKEPLSDEELIFLKKETVI